jgi:hypothetical protein
MSTITVIIVTTTCHVDCSSKPTKDAIVFCLAHFVQSFIQQGFGSFQQNDIEPISL